jgi:uncharacterized membrane protein YhdT
VGRTSYSERGDAEEVRASWAYSPALALLIAAAIIAALFPPVSNGTTGYWPGATVGLLLAFAAATYVLVVFFVRLHRSGGPHLPYAASFIRTPDRGPPARGSARGADRDPPRP